VSIGGPPTASFGPQLRTPRVMRALFTITLFELFLGGGGRLTAVGPVSLRMVLFAACLYATLLAILFPRRRSDGVLFAMLLVLVYLLIHVGGIVVGSFNGGELPQMLSEFQQSLYWLAAPFFAFMIQSEQDAERCARIVQIAGVALASLYIAILMGLLSGLIHLGLVKDILGLTGEAVFRSGEFFIYKGFLYLGISIIFFVAIRGKFWAALVALVAVAMVLTFTRGLILSTAVSLLVMLCMQGRWRTAAPALVLLAAAAFVVWIYLPSIDTNVSASHEQSSSQRYEDMNYMLYHVEANTLLIGEGYGSLINDRSNIENTFLWAWWKLGAPGLLFWLFPLVLCVYYYSKLPNRRSNSVGNAYFFGTILVYVQTNTNPFLNNPIGLSYVLLAMFSLRRLSRSPPNAATIGRGTPAGLEWSGLHK
jgi:hypothetical protein